VLAEEGQPQYTGIQVIVSDPSELRSLREWLCRAPGVEVMQVPAPLNEGELGAFDLLQVLAAAGGGSGALAMAIKTLPDYIRSRRSDLRITLKVNEEQITLEAGNVNDVMLILERLLDAGRP
jgi:hypothetical protein